MVYIPGAPNPWSGSILIVEKARINYLQVTMADAFKTFSGLGSGAKELLTHY